MRWAKCVSLYYLWVAAPTNLVDSAAAGLTLPTFSTLSCATSAQPIGSGVVRKRLETECEDEPRSKQARTLDTTPHYITVKAGSLRYSCAPTGTTEKKEKYSYIDNFFVILWTKWCLHLYHYLYSDNIYITIASRYNCEFFSVTVKRKLSTPARVATRSLPKMKMMIMMMMMMMMIWSPSMNRQVVRRLSDPHR